MKKFRGKKKYYQKLAKRAANFRLELGGQNDWYDLWHQHFDWDGRGNLSGRDRNEHLKSIFTAFDNVLEQLKDYHDPYQVWLFISALDSSQDAIYFHTPNPNKDNFPYTFDGVVWGGGVPALLTLHLKDKYEVGTVQFDDETWYAVRIR